jgi:hypothetical protein
MGHISASEARQSRSGDSLSSVHAPSATEKPIGITCHLCGRELRDCDDLSASENVLVHASCADRQA